MPTYSDPALILPGAVGQTELDAASKKGVASGVAELDASGDVPDAQLPGQLARIATDDFLGDGSVNRAIPHGLGSIPKYIFIMARTAASNEGSQIVNNVYLGHTDVGGHTKVTITAKDSTNFYVNQTTVSNSNGVTYDWMAIA